MLRTQVIPYYKLYVMKNYKDYVIAFMDGYMYAVIGECLTTDNVSEEELDEARHAAEKCVEHHIEQSKLSEDAKNIARTKYKFWVESALQGMKNRLRESGRLL